MVSWLTTTPNPAASCEYSVAGAACVTIPSFSTWSGVRFTPSLALSLAAAAGLTPAAGDPSLPGGAALRQAHKSKQPASTAYDTLRIRGRVDAARAVESSSVMATVSLPFAAAGLRPDPASRRPAPCKG